MTTQIKANYSTLQSGEPSGRVTFIGQCRAGENALLPRPGAHVPLALLGSTQLQSGRALSHGQPVPLDDWDDNTRFTGLQ